jgi:hypothetical protein
MSLHLFGTSTTPAHSQPNESFEHPESVEFINLIESLDEGGEYADDELRMTDQPFTQD